LNPLYRDRHLYRLHALWQLMSRFHDKTSNGCTISRVFVSRALRRPYGQSLNVEQLSHFVQQEITWVGTSNDCVQSKWEHRCGGGGQDDGSGGTSEQEQVKGAREEGNAPLSVHGGTWREVMRRNTYTEAFPDLVINRVALVPALGHRPLMLGSILGRLEHI